MMEALLTDRGGDNERASKQQSTEQSSVEGRQQPSLARCGGRKGGGFLIGSTGSCWSGWAVKKIGCFCLKNLI
jgi:hypothetical protein